ncbi:MAG TPA: MaoC family dehydratase N-terminal domain-containing protein [Actinomycetota bacterium]|nr:MaoC family dehydratase N-terminal domain-containing protein [Actinomycetota bacterium]
MEHRDRWRDVARSHATTVTGTYDALDVGDTFSTPSREVDEGLVSQLVATGGYTHPLFVDEAYAAASPFGRSPLPGAALLLLMGGLSEQTGRFDRTTVALVGYDRVRFRAPALPGDTVGVELTVVEKQDRGSRGLMTIEMTCTNGRGDTLVEAAALYLFERTQP